MGTPRRQRTFSTLFALALCLVARGALAQGTPSVRVTYGAETAACPDAASVLARIGVEGESGPSVEPKLEVTVERGGEEYVASVRQGHRTRVFRSTDCAVATDAAAWVAALALVE